VFRVEFQVSQRLVLAALFGRQAHARSGSTDPVFTPALARRPGHGARAEMLVVLAQSSRQDPSPSYPTLARLQRRPKSARIQRIRLRPAGGSLPERREPYLAGPR
jgi:hypothetical protein